MAKTPTFYLFHGDDDLRIEEEVKKMRAKFGSDPNAELNTSEFDGRSASLNDILGAAMAFPFMSDKRLILVKDLIAHITRKGAGEMGKKAVEMLERQLPNLPDWTRLILIEREKLSDANKILKLAQAQEAGYEKSFLAPKDSTTWIIKRAQDTYQTQIDARAAAALAEVTQGDLRRADNELFKITTYLNHAHGITENDIALLTPYVPEARIFDMVDALTEGRGAVASNMIARLLDQDEDIFGIYAMIVRQFRLLLMAKEALHYGGSPKDLASTLSVHPYAAEKIAKQSRNFDLEQLDQIYALLADYDRKMKTGRIEPRLALELLIASLAR